MEENVNLSWLSSEIGIIASLITILTGVITIFEVMKRRPPSQPPVESPSKIAPSKVKTSIKPSVKGVQEFSGDDQAYQNWVTSNPQGFVVNTYQNTNPRQSDYLALHRAKCNFISNFQAKDPGAFTQREFMKVCATDVSRLREWAKVHGRNDGSFTSEKCGCKPT